MPTKVTERSARQTEFSAGAQHLLPGRRTAFVVLAVILFALETVGRPFDTTFANYLLRILIVVICLALTGWLPIVGGALCCLFVALGLALPPHEAQLSVALLGMYFVAADWVSRGWLLQALLAFTAVEGTQLIVSSNVSGDIPGLIGGLAIAFAGGSALRLADGKLTSSEQRTAAAERNARIARQAVRHDMVVDLHDTLATDLTHALILSESLASRTTDPEAAESLSALAALSRESLGHLRKLMDDQDAGTGAHGDSLTATVASCALVLKSRNIVLESVLPGDIDSLITGDNARVVAVMLRELANNALKYAPEDSAAYLMIESPDGQSIRLAMMNQLGIDTDGVPDPLSGGMGLPHLSERLERLGGTLRFGARNDMWLVVAELPSRSSHASAPRTPASSGGTVTQ